MGHSLTGAWVFDEMQHDRWRCVAREWERRRGLEDGGSTTILCCSGNYMMGALCCCGRWSEARGGAGFQITSVSSSDESVWETDLVRLLRGQGDYTGDVGDHRISRDTALCSGSPRWWESSVLQQPQCLDNSVVEEASS